MTDDVTQPTEDLATLTDGPEVQWTSNVIASRIGLRDALGLRGDSDDSLATCTRATLETRYLLRMRVHDHIAVRLV